MRRKILLYYIILIITGLSTTGLFVTTFAQNLYKNEVRHRLLTVAALFNHELEVVEKNNGKPDYNLLAGTYATILNTAISENNSGLPVITPSSQSNKSAGAIRDENSIESRITVIDSKGNVLGESQTNFHNMENHLGRKEVQQAIQGKTGEDVRFSATLKMNFLYIAVPSIHEGIIIRVSVPLVQLNRIDSQIWLYCLLGIFAGLLLTTLLALGFTSSITKPVRELTYAAKNISGGNYSKRVSIKTRDEFGALAATFNEMAGELDKTMADLKDKNMKFDSIVNSMTNSFVAVDANLRIILINSIASRFFGINQEEIIGCKLIEVIRSHQINEILQQVIADNSSSVSEISIGMPEEGIFRVYASPIRSVDNVNANSGGIITIHDITAVKKLEQIRTDFVSNVTHELKTPLTSIRGFVETLRSGAVNDADVTAKFLEIIDIEAERLTMLINDILQLSEIENRVSDTNISVNKLSEIIAEVVSILQVSADKKGVELVMEADDSIYIKANRDRIKQMFINLIDNAINYNVENGTVRITATKADARINITVADTGIGIAQQHLSRIFERFYRVDKGRSRNMGGTGLGLSIVKHIVNLYDGDIRVESEPGKGTEFILHLPV